MYHECIKNVADPFRNKHVSFIITWLVTIAGIALLGALRAIACRDVLGLGVLVKVGAPGVLRLFVGPCKNSYAYC